MSKKNITPQTKPSTQTSYVNKFEDRKAMVVMPPITVSPKPAQTPTTPLPTTGSSKSTITNSAPPKKP